MAATVTVTASHTTPRDTTVMGGLGVSERTVCRVLGHHRSVQRNVPRAADDEAALRESIIGLARRYGRYGYRRITALLLAEGWQCNHKWVERIWRAEGLKVPARQPKRRPFWLNDDSQVATGACGNC